MKKALILILIGIILAGAIIGFTKGFNLGLIYKNNVSLSVYVGAKIEDREIKQIAKEVFSGERTLVQKIEVYEDMASITAKERSEEELANKKELLANKINEKYGTEIKADEIIVRHNPDIKLLDTVIKYIATFIIVTVIIIIYQIIRFRKLGVLKTMGKSFGIIVVAELVYIALLAITRIPVNRITIPLGIAIYVATITVLNMKYEKELESK